MESGWPCPSKTASKNRSSGEKEYCLSGPNPRESERIGKGYLRKTITKTLGRAFKVRSTQEIQVLAAQEKLGKRVKIQREGGLGGSEFIHHDGGNGGRRSQGRLVVQSGQGFGKRYFIIAVFSKCPGTASKGEAAAAKTSVQNNFFHRMGVSANLPANHCTFETMNRRPKKADPVKSFGRSLDFYPGQSASINLR